MPDESCRKCGKELESYTLCSQCRRPTQKICSFCRMTTLQQPHEHCFERNPIQAEIIFGL